MLSLRSNLRTLSAEARDRYLTSLSPAALLYLKYDWELYARRNQLAPTGRWTVLLALAGRGFGKTRMICEWARKMAEEHVGCRIAIVARTAADLRDVLVEGESGILSISPDWFRPKWTPSNRRLTWPNGSIATTYSAEEPDSLRGPQHHFAVVDELASWRYAESTWNNLMLGLRLGKDPRVLAATTPRPTKLLKTLMAQPTTVVVRGSTYENLANLAPTFRDQIIARYRNTRLGRQELYAEILEDAEGALWKREEMIEAYRVTQFPDLVRVVVAIDPAVTSNAESDETGIVVVGIGKNGHGYVLDDLSLRASPQKWAEQAVAAYHKYRADRIVAEVNNGGDLVVFTLQTIDKSLPVKKLTATREKRTRAEPVAALYEQGRVHHVGTFPDLEDKLCSWEPGERSPDRLDALVWCLTELMLGTVPSIGEYHAELQARMTIRKQRYESQVAQGL